MLVKGATGNTKVQQNTESVYLSCDVRYNRSGPWKMLSLLNMKSWIKCMLYCRQVVYKDTWKASEKHYLVCTHIFPTDVKALEKSGFVIARQQRVSLRHAVIGWICRNKKHINVPRRKIKLPRGRYEAHLPLMRLLWHIEYACSFGVLGIIAPVSVKYAWGWYKNLPNQKFL